VLPSADIISCYETPKMTNANNTNKMLDDDDKNEPINAVGDKKAMAQKQPRL